MRYIVYLYIGQIIKGITFIIMREKIGIIKTADLTLMLILYNYLLYSHLGLRFSVDKELPILFYENKNNEVFEYKSKIFLGIILLQSLVSIICFFTLKDKISHIILILISSLFLSLNETNKIFDRAKQDYKSYSNYTLFYNLMIGIIPCIGAFYFSLYGIIVGYLIVNLFFWILYFPKKVKIIFDNKFILKKIKDNIVFYLINIIIFSFLNLDKLIINKFLTKESLGKYAMGSMFFSFLILLPSGLSEVLFPKLMILVKKKNLTSKKVNILVKRNIEITYLMTAFFIFTLPLFINIFFSKLYESIFIIQLISINIIYYGATGILIYIILAKKDEDILLKEMFKGLVYFLVFLTLFIIYIKKIEIIPIIYAMTYIYLLNKIATILEKNKLIEKNKILKNYIKKQLILIVLCILYKKNIEISVLMIIFILFKSYKENRIYIIFISKKYIKNNKLILKYFEKTMKLFFRKKVI